MRDQRVQSVSLVSTQCGIRYRLFDGEATEPIKNHGEIPSYWRRGFRSGRASVITSKAANSYHFKTGQRDWPSRTEIVLPRRLLWWQVGFRAPASWAALEHMPVV